VEVPIGRHLELKGMDPRLHIPGLAGLSQGPGFANLGALGLLANRVLQPLVPAGLSGGAARNLSRADHNSLLFD
jgi:mycobactin lysine-N-oxygenase